MFSNFPFGFSNNCGPVGCVPFNGSPVSGFNGWCGDVCSPFNCSPISGWNSGFGGFNGFNGFGGSCFPGYNGFSSINNCSPVGFNNWSNWGIGANNWNNSWNCVPFGGFGYNNWNGFGFSNSYNHPIACNVPFSGMHQGVGFPGMNWNGGWNGYNSPWMNWGACFPGSQVNSFVGGSPISGVSNWFNSPWMGYAYPGFTQNSNVVNGKSNFVSPVNGQYVPNSAFPFPCAPFNVPFQSNGYNPGSNGFVPAGPAVNCEAA